MQHTKKSIIEQDLILIYVEEKPAFFGRVEKITPDVKKNWWRVAMLVLQIPVKIVTWILDDDQIRGADFTMSGIPVRIEKVEVPREELKVTSEFEKNSVTGVSNVEKDGDSEKPEKQARILSFAHKKEN